MITGIIAALTFVLWLLAWYQQRQPQSFEPNAGPQSGDGLGLVPLLERWSHDKLVRWCLFLLFMYTLTLAILQLTWYGKDGMVPFHWFDDLDEWQQIDKLGHYLSTFHVARVLIYTFWNNNLGKRSGTLVGGISAFLLISMYEWFDGHSPSYGASAYDIAANGLGALSASLQLWFWGQARVLPQLSFHSSPYAALRPNVLGNGLSEAWIKDYNGQTIWFLFNPHYLLGWKRWPHWLGISLGYGGEQMLYGRLLQNHEHGYHPYHQWYIALGPDLTFLRSNRYLAVRRMMNIVDIVRIPTPALELNMIGQATQLVFYPIFS